MTTPLSTILARMQRYQTAATAQEQYLVADLDEAMRSIRRETQLPWMLKKSTIRVFDGVLLYPTAADHDFLAYLDTQQNDNIASQGIYGDRLRARYTSLQQFYEDPDNRNVIAEIWQSNTKYLGIRDKIMQSTSVQIDDASLTTGYTASQDANTVTLDTVNFTTGISSVRFINTPTMTAQATITLDPFLASIGDVNYQQNYFFIWVYLSGTPTSITLKFGNNSSNYLYHTVTTQFAGQPLLAGDWNLVAIDLNVATTFGTLNPYQFNYFAVTLNGAPAGVYNVDASYFRQWQLLDYWYYSRYQVQTIGSTVANQEFFNVTFGDYKLDSQLVGDSEWVEVVMYDALMSTMMDKKDTPLFEQFSSRRQSAWANLMKVYPSDKPTEVTLRWRFATDYAGDYYNDDPIQ